MPREIRPYGVPGTLPCGCPLKRGRVWICTHVLKLKNGLYVCKCGCLWKWKQEDLEFRPVPASVLAPGLR
jgi:hypothetical protein